MFAAAVLDAAGGLPADVRSHSALRQCRAQLALTVYLQVERSRKEGEFSGQLATRLRESNKAAQVGPPSVSTCQLPEHAC